MLHDESLCKYLMGDKDGEKNQNQCGVKQLDPDALIQDVITNCQHHWRRNHDHIADSHQLLAVPGNAVGKIAG